MFNYCEFCNIKEYYFLEYLQCECLIYLDYKDFKFI